MIVIMIIQIIIHPVSITRFPLRRFSPGAGLLRNRFFHRQWLRFSRGWVRKDGNLVTETRCIFCGGAYKSASWSHRYISYRGLCSGGGGGNFGSHLVLVAIPSLISVARRLDHRSAAAGLNTEGRGISDVERARRHRASCLLRLRRV